MGDTQATIELLAADMRDEHAAIVQYLQHAYAMGESGEACEVEAVARDEMRHFDWLADAIVDLGGDPDMGRSAVDLAGKSAPDWMAHDVQAEERAIAQYEAHIETISDAKVVRLLSRILSDERSHRETFIGLGAELTAEGAQDVGPLEERPAEGAAPGDLAILQEGVRHEYSVILQYLYHNFVMPQCEVGRELEMQAINEMQHLGWLAEGVAERGGHPEIQRGDVSLEGSAAEMLQADIDAERAVTAAYEEQIAQLSDEELRELLERIREHEIYHDAVFSDLLQEVANQGVEKRAGFTVGSLLG